MYTDSNKHFLVDKNLTHNHDVYKAQTNLRKHSMQIAASTIIISIFYGVGKVLQQGSLLIYYYCKILIHYDKLIVIYTGAKSIQLIEFILHTPCELLH